MRTSSIIFIFIIIFSNATFWAVPDLKRITFEAGNKKDPSFSPDGKWIAYLTKKDGGETLCLKSGGSNETFLFPGESYSWVDKDKILFTFQDRIFLRDLKEEENEFLAFGQKPAVSFNGDLIFVREGYLWIKRKGDKEEKITCQERLISDFTLVGKETLVLAADGDLWKINLREGGEKLFIKTAQADLDYFTSLKASPDQKKLIVVSSGIKRADNVSSSSLLIVDATDGSKVRIGPGNFPAWSPDGREIVYVSEGNLWTADSAGINKQVLTRERCSDKEPAWSPDGREILFISSRIDTNKDGLIDWRDTNDLWIYSFPRAEEKE